MPFTYDDLVQIGEEFHYEIFNGECVVNQSPIPQHQNVLGNIAFRLRGHAEATNSGVVFASPVDVVFTPMWVFKPDMLYVKAWRKAIITETNISGAPDLIGEVIGNDTRERDEIIKRNAYEMFGVGEYWLIDPESESVKIYQRNHTGRYVETEVGEMLTSPLFPGLEISLAEVFAE